MAIEIYDGSTWTKLINSNDFQQGVILPILATGKNNAQGTISTVDGVNIPVGFLFLLTDQTNSTDNGVYAMLNNNTHMKITPQPLGVYISSGNTMSNTLFFNNGTIWKNLLTPKSKKRK